MTSYDPYRPQICQPLPQTSLPRPQIDPPRPQSSHPWSIISPLRPQVDPLLRPGFSSPLRPQIDPPRSWNSHRNPQNSHLRPKVGYLRPQIGTHMRLCNHKQTQYGIISHRLLWGRCPIYLHNLKLSWKYMGHQEPLTIWGLSDLFWSYLSVRIIVRYLNVKYCCIVVLQYCSNAPAQPSVTFVLFWACSSLTVKCPM